MWAATLHLAACMYSICKYIQVQTRTNQGNKLYVCTYILNDMLNYSIGLVGAYVHVRMKKPIRIN